MVPDIISSTSLYFSDGVENGNVDKVAQVTRDQGSLLLFFLTETDINKFDVTYQWRIQGGATGARPLKLDLLWLFITHFVLECLKLGLRLH